MKAQEWLDNLAKRLERQLAAREPGDTRPVRFYLEHNQGVEIIHNVRRIANALRAQSFQIELGD